MALPASPPHSSLPRALRTLSPITPAPKYTQSSLLEMSSRVQTVHWLPPLSPRPCAICATPCQTSYTSMVPVFHHPLHPRPRPSIPVRSTAHAHALSPSRPTYHPSPGSIRNVTASSAHVVEHRPRLVIYELAAVVIATFRQVRHTSLIAEMTVVRRLNSRPSGLIGNSCFASSAFFTKMGRILGTMLRRGRSMNCIIGILRNARGGNERGQRWQRCALDRNRQTLMRTHVRSFHVVNGLG
jgi:hypothetical protein